jgi:hypothetical protein
MRAPKSNGMCCAAKAELRHKIPIGSGTACHFLAAENFQHRCPGPSPTLVFGEGFPNVEIPGYLLG